MKKIENILKDIAQHKEAEIDAALSQKRAQLSDEKEKIDVDLNEATKEYLEKFKEHCMALSQEKNRLDDLRISIGNEIALIDKMIYERSAEGKKAASEAERRREDRADEERRSRLYGDSDPCS